MRILNFDKSHESKSLLFVPYMGVFLIDSWDLNKQDNEIKFLRQAVSVSEEHVPLE